MKMKVEVFNTLGHRLNEIRDKSTNLQPLLKEITRDMQKETLKRFEVKKDPDGNK